MSSLVPNKQPQMNHIKQFIWGSIHLIADYFIVYGLVTLKLILIQIVYYK